MRTRTALFALVAIVLVLLVLEGVAGLGLWIAGPRPEERPPRQRRHTRYEPELGWINEASIVVEDLYGPGIGLSTDERGFRIVPPSSLLPDRTVLCSGDSFTLGYGVGDAETWPARFAARNPGARVLNLGHAGYGVDQAWLLARRTAPDIPHHVHLFAVIAEEFYRCRYDDFRGYGKPLLAIENGRLVATGTPVPQPTPPGGARERFRLYRALRRLVGRPPAASPARLPLSEATRLAVGALAGLAREEAERGVSFVVVWLPTSADLIGDEDRERLRVTVLDALDRHGVETIDLTPDLFRLSPASIDRCFLPVETDFGRHYSAAGNDWVARRLTERGILAAP